MTEAKQSSNKRKRLLPSTTTFFMGIFTRSKSQIYLHRNRSGRVRRDSVQHRNHHHADLHHYPSLNKKPRSESPEDLSAMDDLSSCISIKDLRARRVFSPASIGDDRDLRAETEEGKGCEKGIGGLENGFSCVARNLDVKIPGSCFDTDGIIRSCLDDIVKECEENDDVTNLEIGSFGNEVIESDSCFRKDSPLGVCLDSAKVCEDGDSEKFDAGWPRKDQDMENRNCVSCFDKDDMVGDCFDGVKECEDGMYPKLSGPKFVVEERGSDEEGLVSDGVAADLKEEYVQTTPPDVEIFGGKQEVAGNGNVKGDFDSQTMDQQSNGTMQKIDKCLREDFRASIDKRNDNHLRTKSVLNPCRRMKLFKTPGSFSYRRLLPYLMNIAKDNSCATKTGQSPKTEKSLEEKSHRYSHSQEISIDKPKTDSCQTEGHNGGSGDGLNLVSIKHSTESSMPTDSHKNFCTMVNPQISMADECYSKPLFNGEIRNFKVGVSSEDQNLNSSSHDMCLIMEDSQSDKDNPTGTHSGDTKLVENGEIKKAHIVFSCSTQNVNNIDRNLSSITYNRLSDKDDETGQYSDDTKQFEAEGMKKSNIASKPNWRGREGKGKICNGDALDQNKDSNEEITQMTPPDCDLFSEPKAAENRGDRIKSVLQSADRVSAKPSNGSFHRDKSFLGDKGIESSPKGKSVLNQCSRLKLFKTPGSLGYRRLLPFFMDIAKDNSCPGNGNLQFEKSLEQKTLSTLSVSDCQETPNASFNSSDYGVDCSIYDYSALPMAMSNTARGSCNDDDPKLMSPEHGSEFPAPLNSQKEQETQVELVISDTKEKLEIAHDIVDSRNGPPTMPLCSRVGSESVSREGATFMSDQLSVNTEGNCIKSIVNFANGAKPNEANNSPQNSSQLEDSVPWGIHTVGSQRGILKRNPRGCRGLCTCLNCSTFHLHAGRAFEFSRNQMQDAEEVVLDLVKEISHVRDMMERSVTSVDDHAVLCTNQVKEVCRKASEAEKLAKDRLSQMNNDLYAHCRVPCKHRPRVTFANYVQETVIPRED